MGRILTKRHSSLFEKKVRNPFSFVRDVHKSGKLRELFSFIVWEIQHRLHLFPRQEYVRFSNDEVITLDGENLNGGEFRQKIEHYFAQKGLSVIRANTNWKLLFISASGEIFGCLYPDDHALFKSAGHEEQPIFVQRFPEQIRSIFISSQNTIFVCVNGAVYRSADGGDTFQKSLDLGSPVSFFRHNNGITETPQQTLIIAEYGNIWEEQGWRQLAYLYFSADEGETWERTDFLIARGVNKHVHLVKYSRLFNKVFMADGDNYKKLWFTKALTGSELCRPENWIPVTRFHIQMGGYTAVIEDEEQVLFGTDYQGGTNFLVATRDGEKFEKKIIPDPYRRSPIDNMVQRKSGRGNEIWANLPFSVADTKCLLMYTDNGGESWHRVVEYSRNRHVAWLISSAHDGTGDLYFSIEDFANGDRVVFRVSA